METVIFDPIDNEAVIADLKRRCKQMKKAREECRHCSRKAKALTIMWGIITNFGGIKEAHIVTIPVCKKHSVENPGVDAKNQEIALRQITGFYKSVEIEPIGRC